MNTSSEIEIFKRDLISFNLCALRAAVQNEAVENSFNCVDARDGS